MYSCSISKNLSIFHLDHAVIFYLFVSDSNSNHFRFKFGAKGLLEKDFFDLIKTISQTILRDQVLITIKKRIRLRNGKL